MCVSNQNPLSSRYQMSSLGYLIFRNQDHLLNQRIQCFQTHQMNRWDFVCKDQPCNYLLKPTVHSLVGQMDHQNQSGPSPLQRYQSFDLL
uniref:Uncharacterized protein n=1 Tax=uncultured marine virus TaxID=186617 RepID=A0A0F7L5X4_9VIRU|nr:hypothetical protein [uncultured marine virus]